jgi:acyl-CoA synthetase (AMP-forming)/AMP-acid ligase II
LAGDEEELMDLQFANLWEAVTDAVGDRLAVVHGDTRLTWAEYDDQAARLAGALQEWGVGPGSKVALYLYNSAEYLIGQYAACKVRAAPVNVNYRYLDTELAYLLNDSEAEILIYHRSLGDRVAKVVRDAPRLRAVIEVDDGGTPVEGSHAFAEVVAGHEPAGRIERPGDDLYLLYTGGTTGMPKGVMYHQGQFMAQIANAVYMGIGMEPLKGTEDVAAAVRQIDQFGAPVAVVGCPLMHGTGMWLGVFFSHAAGGASVTLVPRSLDCDELWRAVERERATNIAIVGDAFARPMLRALDEALAAGRPYDISSVRMMISSGAMWSAEIKQGLLAHHDMRLVDTMGSTEGGMGQRVTTRDAQAETASFDLNPATKVFAEDGREVEPGSGIPGMMATPAVSLGYFKDESKTARTFREVDGVRYVFPGDWAVVEADGTIRLLGRGSQCINSGGEKIFPEEVEESIKRHPTIEDCLVVGIADERFGEQVVAVASTVPSGSSDVTETDILEFLRDELASYKLPRRIILVDVVQRAANGKADYPWARSVATAAGASTASASGGGSPAGAMG